MPTPRAAPIPVELSLWSLCRPVSDARPRTSGAAVSNPADLAALRLDRLASVSEAATRTVVESAVADGYDWFTGWVHVLQDAQRAVEQTDLRMGANVAWSRGARWLIENRLLERMK